MVNTGSLSSRFVSIWIDGQTVIDTQGQSISMVGLVDFMVFNATLGFLGTQIEAKIDFIKTDTHYTDNISDNLLHPQPHNPFNTYLH